MKFVKQIPNIITGIRICAAIVLFFLKPLSLEYLLVYGICGLSDAFDGILARALHAESRFGSIIDSISDIIFYMAMVITLFPIILEIFGLAHFILAVSGLALQMAGYIICAFKYRRFSSVHTYLNKTLGLFFFVFPFSLIGQIPLLYNIYYFIGASVANLAGLEIVLIHCLSKQYSEKNKSIFLLKKNEADFAGSQKQP